MKKDLSITPKGVEILKEKETHLDTKKISDKWMSKYVLAKKYYEHYGSLEMPAKFKTKNGVDYDDEGVQLGPWIRNIKYGIKGLNSCKITQEQIKLLEDIGLDCNNDVREEDWNNKYKLAKTYYEYYGNLEIPQRFKTKNGIDYDEDGIKLGIWIHSQRKAINGKNDCKITPERMQLLESIGIRIDSTYREKQWMKKYNLAKTYYEHYGNLNINRKFKTLDGINYDEQGVQLRRWLDEQRFATTVDNGVKLTPQRIKMLEEIGFDFSIIDRDKQWMSKYELVKTYYEYYGNLNIPIMFRTLDGINYDEQGIRLGVWLSEQRRRMGNNNELKLEPERIKLLKDIGLDFKVADKEKQWMEKYKLVKAYYEHYGNLDVPIMFKTSDGIKYDKQGIKIGTWLYKQRQGIKGINNYKVTPEHIKLLEEIGIDCNNIGRENKWMNKYKLAKAYYEHYGNLKIPKNFKTKNGVDYDEEGVKLRNWLQNQFYGIMEINNMKITPEHIKLLEEIGIDCNNIGRENKWMKKYNLAKIYYEYYGDLDIPIMFRTLDGINYDEDGIKLGVWLSTQKQRIKEKSNLKVTQEHIKLLEEIGLDYNNIDKQDKWINKYILAKAYYEHYGNLKIKQRFKTKNGIDYDEEGVKLGFWINSQREGIKGQNALNLTPKQIKLLDNIGMIWFTDIIDNKLQDEKITDKNIKAKQIEMRNRFYSVLNSFEDEELPTKEELNNKLLCKLNHRK